MKHDNPIENDNKSQTIRRIKIIEALIIKKMTIAPKITKTQIIKLQKKNFDNPKLKRFIMLQSTNITKAK